MKAVIHEKYGPPEVLEVVELDMPTPKDNEVLIKIHATTLNRTDTGMRSAAYFVSRFVTGLFRPKLAVTGTEFAGIVTTVGADVKEYKVGDKVFGFDDSSFGAHAEYKVEPSAGPMAKIPSGFSYHEVAAAGEGATYALNILEAAKVKKGQNILIYGASGAIGSAAVQICKHLGTKVTAVCGTKNVKLIKSLGADKVYDYQTEDFTGTSDKFDLIVDAVGKSSYGVCKPLLAPNGTYVSSELGRWGQNVFLAIWFAATGKRKVIFPIPKINKEKMNQIKLLLESGDYKPVVDSMYDLEDIVEATKYVETGQKTGNVIIRVI
jgi:NADPH:quinone reductase-like Zn-dependent oxidoreductase